MDRRKENQEIHPAGVGVVLTFRPRILPMLLPLCRLLLVFGVAAVLSSCTTRSALRLERLEGLQAQGDYRAAVDRIKRDPGLYGNTSRFLYFMDIGTLYHYAGMYDSSTAYLLRAANLYDELYTRSVTNEAAAFLTNDNVRPYRSKPFEIVFVHQMLELNYLARQQVDDAVVEARRTQLLFDGWEKKDTAGPGPAGGGMFHYLSSICWDAAGKSDDAMISLFASVRAFKSGPVRLPPWIGSYAAGMLMKNNREDDVKSLALPPAAADTARFSNERSEVILIGYAGKGPVFADDVWWGTYVVDGFLVLHHTRADGSMETVSMLAPPLVRSDDQGGTKGRTTKSGTTLHIKFALPALRTLPSQTAGFTLRADTGRPVTAAVINDFDLQAARYLEDNKGSTLARTAARVALRTFTAQKTKQELATNSPLANLVISIISDVAADQLEKADTRICFLAPKTVQCARVALSPGRHTIEVTSCDQAGAALDTKSYDIALGPHEKKVIFCTSLR